MTDKEKRFDDVIKYRLSETENILYVKGKEYRRNDNPFHNFDEAARIHNTTPERALLGFMAKHHVSVLDIVNDIDSGKNPTVAQINEKVGDMITYLFLLEALLKERISECGDTFDKR